MVVLTPDLLLGSRGNAVWTGHIGGVELKKMDLLHVCCFFFFFFFYFKKKKK